MNQENKQTINTSIVVVMTIILGFVNSILIMPNTLPVESIGFYRNVVAFISVFAIFSQFGLRGVILKYQPLFSKSIADQKTFNIIVLVLLCCSVALFTGIVYLIKDVLLGLISDDLSQGIFKDYYFIIILSIIPFSFFSVLEAICSLYNKTTIPRFFTGTFGRILILAVLLLVYSNVLNVEQFYLSIVIIFYIQFILLAIYVFVSIPKINGSDFKTVVNQTNPKAISKYMIFGIFFGVSYYLVEGIDNFMISFLSEDGFVSTGIYATFSVVGLLVGIPAQAIVLVYSPQIAKQLHEKNWENVKLIYRKTSIFQYVFGGLLFVGIVGNIDNITSIISASDEIFKSGSLVLVFIGFAKLIDMLAGSNGAVIVYSKYYKWDVVFMLLLIAMSILFNYYVLIVLQTGVIGVAIATFLAIVLHNVIRFVFIYQKFKMHPFQIKHLYITAIILVVLLLQWMIFEYLNLSLWLDLLARSAFITIVYGLFLYQLNIIPDAKNMILSIMDRFKNK